MQDLALSTLFEVVESHKFLTLPRLSSQGVMDQICPPESSKSRKKLCVVLVNRGKDVHTDPLEELKRSHLRSFIQVRLKLDPFSSILEIFDPFINGTNNERIRSKSFELHISCNQGIVLSELN